MSLKEVAKRLVLWHTPTFCPLMSHDDLEPILSSIGFISLPAHPRQPPSPSTASSADAQWKEYAFHSAAAAAAAVSGCIPPRPRLPFPMICGLHIIAYKAFLGALECYVDPSDLFHVRTMSVNLLPEEDIKQIYRPINESDVDELGIFVYRKGTIYRWMFEQIAFLRHRAETHEDDDDRRIKGRRRDNGEIIMVSLDDLLPGMYTMCPSPFPENAELQPERYSSSPSPSSP